MSDVQVELETNYKECRRGKKHCKTRSSVDWRDERKSISTRSNLRLVPHHAELDHRCQRIARVRREAERKDPSSCSDITVASPRVCERPRKGSESGKSMRLVSCSVTSRAGRPPPEAA